MANTEEVLGHTIPNEIHNKLIIKSRLLQKSENGSRSPAAKKISRGPGLVLGTYKVGTLSFVTSCCQL